MNTHYLYDAHRVISGPVELPIIPGLGIQLPSNAVSLKQVLAAPPAGQCWLLDNGKAVLVADCRGEAYNTKTGEPEQYSEPGPLPEGLTPTPRPSPDCAWIDGQWKLDASLQAQNIETARKELHNQIDTERNRRIDAGIEFQGKSFQSRPTDRENITGAAQLAFMAVVAGIKPGDLRWSAPDYDFAWIASDNSLVTMDAHTVVQFGKAVAERKKALIFAARQLKNMELAPLEITKEEWWP